MSLVPCLARVARSSVSFAFACVLLASATGCGAASGSGRVREPGGVEGAAYSPEGRQPDTTADVVREPVVREPVVTERFVMPVRIERECLACR